LSEKEGQLVSKESKARFLELKEEFVDKVIDGILSQKVLKIEKKNLKPQDNISSHPL